ncbi:MAG: hypothetical protein ACKVQV_02965 [Bacteroidia bacterium]
MERQNSKMVRALSSLGEGVSRPSLKLGTHSMSCFMMGEFYCKDYNVCI